MEENTAKFEKRLEELVAFAKKKKNVLEYHEEILSRLERGASDKAFERRSEVMDKLEIIKKLLG